MKLQDIRAIAHRLQIKSSGQTKADLIRTIQRQEGNFDCYGSTDNGECDQSDCLWRGDCLASTKE